MPALKYKVNLTEDEKLGLEAMINKGKASARSLTRARILLKAAAGIQDKAIIQALAISESMVLTTRQRCVEEGPEAALKERPRPGRDHWTLRLLADKVVELAYADRCSYETIRQLLKKHPKTLAEARVVHSRGEC
jgi:transposase